MDGVHIKFVDMEWDVRDAMIEFVGSLFKPTLTSSMDIEKADASNNDDDIQMVRSKNNKINYHMRLKMLYIYYRKIKWSLLLQLNFPYSLSNV